MTFDNDDLFWINKLFCVSCGHLREMHNDTSGCYSRVKESKSCYNNICYCDCSAKYKDKEKFKKNV